MRWLAMTRRGSVVMLRAVVVFLTKVLADPVSHELRTGDAPALDGYAFFLDYGMKAGGLDHEKETILAHHRSTAKGAAGRGCGPDMVNLNRAAG